MRSISPENMQKLRKAQASPFSQPVMAYLVIPPFLALARNRGQAARANFCLGVMPPRAIFGLS